MTFKLTPLSQYAQFVHDELFHTDIYTLDKKSQIQHYALHLAKYSGRLFHHPTGSLEFVDVASKTSLDSMCILISLTTALRGKVDHDILVSQTLFGDILSDYVRHTGTIARGVLKGIDIDTRYLLSNVFRLFVATACLRGALGQGGFAADVAHLTHLNTIQKKHPFAAALIPEFVRRTSDVYTALGVNPPL